MNTNALKKFAREARIKLLDQVGRKLEYVLTADTAELRGMSKQIDELRGQINKYGKEQVIEKVSYIWFNRLMALRFMDANCYNTPMIVTPLPGYLMPEVLQEAKAGNFDESFQLDRKRLNDLLDGKTQVADAQTEAFKMLLIASCNLLYNVMPFMFERISDYTELLLPDDLLSEYSIVTDIRNGMSEEDCKQEEVIGWLYQFYIADKKDKVISAKKKYKTEELPEATQLFTPHWMVKYIVDNTLGRIWLEARPNSNLKDHLEFYIEPADQEAIPNRNIKTPEEIKFLDPASGSAHILVYAFQLFTKIYEEEGYNPSEIPNLIIEKNLFGLEIDERAATIGRFALTMKATAYRKRYLRSPTVPKIFVFEESEEIAEFKNAKTIGSLIRIGQSDYDKIKVEKGSIFEEKQKQIKEIAFVLSQKYDCVVSNPPYVNSSYMNAVLTEHVKVNYKQTKSDLFACFLMRSLEFTKQDGVVGFVCPFVWMFISSYEWLRNYVIEETTIQNLIQLEYNAFEPACVPICTFTLKNTQSEINGDYFRLSDFRGYENQPLRTLEAINNPSVNFRFKANQQDFKKIPGAPISYWASESVFKIFEDFEKLASSITSREGMATANNNKFLRYWHEVEYSKIGFNLKNYQEALNSGMKWFPYNKGGAERKWYGNNEYVVNWSNDGAAIKNNIDPITNRIRSHNYNGEFGFREGLTWSSITISNISIRYCPQGFLFDSKGAMAFPNDEYFKYNIALINSVFGQEMLKILAPTMDYKVGDIIEIPLKKDIDHRKQISDLTDDCISIMKLEWDSHETSWDFENNQLIKLNVDNSLQSSFDNYCKFWNELFSQIHKSEEKINEIILNVYDLNTEFSSSIAFDNLTLLRQETYIDENNQLIFKRDEIIKQFNSYSIGCIFGRYSLDKMGLILANQGESLKDYLQTVSNPTFLPDEDNIIPVLEGEYFTDDVVGRFKRFLKIAFGEDYFEENLKFIEDSIGKDIRKYFTKDFFNDHLQRYKKRPIYWMFSSPKGFFKALIYMHRYRPDTVSKLLNDYLRTYITKLESEKQSLNQTSISESATARERTISVKRISEIETILKDLKDYERTLFDVAAKKIEIDLDDGVKINYLKFKDVLVPIKGLDKDEE
jgi:type II restriction/modification system DNA methylase subunit YeeA